MNIDKNSKWYRYLKATISFLLSQWFIIILACFIALAHSYPNFAKQGGTIKAEYTINYGAVAVIFLISGIQMPTRDLGKNMLHFRAHFTVLSLSFLITSSIIFGIVTGIKASHNGEIDEWILVGLIVTHSCPTTIASNVVMTKKAHGNDILTLCEVFIGNVLGAFVTPALIQMYARGTWDFGNPTHQAGDDNSIGDLYRDVMKQVGLAVFLPLFVGQVAQNIIPKVTKWCTAHLYLAKVGSLMLIFNMWQAFSTAFAQNAFNSVPPASIIFVVFFNIGVYLFFTCISYFYSRPLFIYEFFSEEPNESSSSIYRWSYQFFKPFYYSRKDTVAIMLCGPAKTAALGVSLVSSQYGSHNENLGKLLVPLVLYQAEQVVTAQVLVTFMRKWIELEHVVPSDVESKLEPVDEESGGDERSDERSDDKGNVRDDEPDKEGRQDKEGIEDGEDAKDKLEGSTGEGARVTSNI